MATVARLNVDLTATTAAFRAEMIRASHTANTQLGAIKAQAAGVSTAMAGMGRAMVGFGVFEGLRRGIKTLIDTQLQMQQIHFTLVSATGSASTAADAFAFVKDEAYKLGLSLQPAADGFAKLSASASALHVPMQQQKDLFDAFGKASITLHLSTEKSNAALLALEQMFSKGKIQAQELRLQLGQAIPGAAERMQLAIMKAVQGTDLQGKSFDQLLKSGELYTDRFVPQMIQALLESARGSDLAANSLIAQIGRLQSAWFELKDNLSGGVFNDAAITGIRLMADNLKALAAVIELSLGVAISRYAAKLATLASTKITASVITPRAAAVGGVENSMMAASAAQSMRQNALATSMVTDANVKRLSSELAKRNATIATTQATVAGIQADVDARAAKLAVSQANLEAASTATAHRSAIASVNANTRILTVNEDLLAASTRRLTLQENLRNNVQARVVALTEAQRAANVQLDISNGLVIGSTTALALANERLAATGIAANIAKMGSSLGKFALGLVGGWWGVAALAVGGLAMSFASARAASAKFREETAAQVKDMQNLAVAVNIAAQEYGTLGTSVTLAQAMETSANAKKELAAKTEELEKQKQIIADIEASMRAPVQGAGGPLAGQNLVEAKERLAALQAEMAPTEAASASLAAQFNGGLSTAVDGLRNAIASVKAGGTLGDFVRNLASPEDVAAGVKSVLHAQDLVNGSVAAMQSMGDKARKDLLTKGHTPTDLLQAELTNSIVNIQAQAAYLSPEKQVAQVLAARKIFDEQIKDVKQAQDEAAARKHTPKAPKATENNLLSSQQGELESARQQALQNDKLVSAQNKLNMAHAGAISDYNKLTAAEKLKWDAGQKTLVQAQLKIKASEQQRQIDADSLILQQNLADKAAGQQRDQARELGSIGHGAQWAQQRAGMDAISDAYDAMRVSEDRTYQADKRIHGETDAADAAHLAQIKLISDAEAAALGARIAGYAQDAAARADSVNGMRSALEDYNSKAADVAGNTQATFSSAFDGMGTSLANFVLTGKGGFKSLADSIISDLVKMEARIAISQILMSLVGAMGYDVSGGAGASTYNSAGFVSHVDFGGGRAGGGAVAGGTMYRVNEKGPELYQDGSNTYLMAGSRGGNVVPVTSGGGGGGGGGGVKVVIENHTDVKPEVSQSTGAHGESIITVLMKQVDTRMNANAANPNSDFGKIMKSTYGLQRRGVSVGG